MKPTYTSLLVSLLCLTVACGDAQPECGNGVVEGDEICDGSQLAGADCASEGFDYGELSCASTCDAFVTDACVEAVCRNGEIEPSEECDANDLDGQTCDTRGFDSGTLTCDPGECTFDITGCGICGNDLVDGDEDCDGSDLGDENCVSLGFLGGSVACAPDCSYDASGCEALPDVAIGVDAVFDTDLGELDGSPVLGWDDSTATWPTARFDVAMGATLTVVGGRPLTIEAIDAVSIAGTIDVSGEDGGVPTTTEAACDTAGVGGVAGPGGFDGGVGAGNGGTGTENGGPGGAPLGVTAAGGGRSDTATSGVFGGAGGGGAGHATPGVEGSAGGGATAGTAGAAYDSLPPVVGGAGGGGGGVEKDGPLGDGLNPADDEGAGGGGGGGALVIRSDVSITLTGLIDASGGTGGDDPGCVENTGLGGGGAGGAVWLSSPLTDTAGGDIDVSGGPGGEPTSNPDTAADLAGGDGADGRVRID